MADKAFAVYYDGKGTVLVLNHYVIEPCGEDSIAKAISQKFTCDNLVVLERFNPLFESYKIQTMPEGFDLFASKLCSGLIKRHVPGKSCIYLIGGETDNWPLVCKDLGLDHKSILSSRARPHAVPLTHL